MKILIITTFFPPQNSIASLRPYSWAKYWKKTGHDITILTTDKVKTDVDLLYDCSDFNIISLPVNIPFAKTRKDLKSNTKEDEKKGIYSRARLWIFSIIKRIYTNFSEKTGCYHTCRYPDWHDTWVRYVIRYIKTNTSVLQNIDFVISTGGPYSVHRIGFYIKKKYPDIKWIVDWRDLWTKNPEFPGLFLFRWYEQLLEKRFHSMADMITTVSEGLAAELSEITTVPVNVVYNGYDIDDYKNIISVQPKINTKLTFVYTGSIYAGYDIMPFLQAVSNLIKRSAMSINDISIIFAGSNADCIDQITKFGLQNCYTYLGYLSRNDALKLQYNADIALFFVLKSPSIKGWSAGKLFEYILVAKEIWSIGSIEKTDADAIIEKSNAGIYFGEDVGKIEKAILDTIKVKKVVRDKNMDFISQFSREKQANKIIELIQKYSLPNISQL